MDALAHLTNGWLSSVIIGAGDAPPFTDPDLTGHAVVLEPDAYKASDTELVPSARVALDLRPEPRTGEPDADLAPEPSKGLELTPSPYSADEEE